jgi:DNA-nicking Smr family endonuclease
MSRKKRIKKHAENKYQHLAEPQAEFDFHGRIWESQRVIKEAVDRFIVECRDKEFKKILIVTGKGIHSQNGPVVKPVVLGYLGAREDVKSVVDAPVNFGGSGALMVLLF